MAKGPHRLLIDTDITLDGLWVITHTRSGDRQAYRINANNEFLNSYQLNQKQREIACDYEDALKRLLIALTHLHHVDLGGEGTIKKDGHEVRLIH